MLKLIGAASAPNLFEKAIGFPGEGAAAQMQNEQGLGRPIHSFHKLCGDLTLEKHSPVKKAVSVQRFAAATSGLPARKGSGHNFVEGGRVNLKCAPQC